MIDAESASVPVRFNGSEYRVSKWVWQQICSEVVGEPRLTIPPPHDSVAEVDRRCINLIERGFLDAE